LRPRQPLATPARPGKALASVAGELIAAQMGQWRNEAHKAQWRSTLEGYCEPVWGLPVDEVDTAAVLEVLQPLWQRIPETASRLRGRIEAVLDYAKAHGLRKGENPAAWRGHLALILPKRPRLTRGHHGALPYDQVPAFLVRDDTVTARARIPDLDSLPLGRSARGEVG
jgi:integrase